MAFRYSMVWGTAGMAAILFAVGCSGADGATGPQGSAGPAGTSGKDGVKGADGTDGATGANGDKGADGKAGADGAKGADGADGAKGADGADGANGLDGDAGAPGLNGDAGSPGEPGKDGLAILVGDRHGLAALEAMDLAAGKYMVDATITAVTADDTGLVTVEFKVMTKDGKPVTGVTGEYFNISKLAAPNAGEAYGNWTSYVYRTKTVKGAGFPKPDGYSVDQAYRENNGVSTDHGDGTYTYVFSTNISAITTPVAKTAITYDRALLHRVALMLGGHTGPTASAFLDFVPNGGQAPATRDIVPTAACNNCHTSVTGHGGDRIGLENCVTCHQAGSFDAYSGNTIDMKVMTHKIHAGGELASIPGADGIVFDNPATAADESADNGKYAIYNYVASPVSWWKAEFPAILANCTKCHDGKGAQVDNWKDAPSRAVCGSCHDTIDWVTGANHKGGKATNDTGCVNCHNDGVAPSPVTAHDWVGKDPRKNMEFKPTMTVTGAANGKFFVKGETPVVHIALTDVATKALIDHTTMVVDDGVTANPPGNGAEGCVANAAGTACTVARDGKFTGSSFFVSGPRERRSPVLTTKARVVVKSTNASPVGMTYSLASATGKTTLGIIADNGQDLFVDDGKILVPAAVTVPVYATGASGEVALTPAWVAGATTTTFTDANQVFLGANKTWIDHQYAGYTVTVTNNSASGKPTATYTVVDNVGTTMTVTGVWAYKATDILTYASFGFAGAAQGKATGGSLTTLADSAAKWTVDQWKGFSVKVLSGTGLGQVATITGNTATTLTFAAVAAAADATSVYSVQQFADVSKATPTEVVAWLNNYAPFKARAIAYLDSTAAADSATSAVAVAGTTFTVKAGNGVQFPLAGSVILDRYTPVEETLAFTRATDTFTVAPAAYAHAIGATIRVNVASSVAIRSRNLGDFFGLQVASGSVGAASALFPADVLGGYPVHVLGSNTPGATNTLGTASTVSNTLAKPTDALTDDAKIKRTATEIAYTLDPVDDLAPGTYIAKIEINDRGTKTSDIDFQTPTVGQIAFQVGTATEEKPPANNCGSCHTDPTDTKGFVLDFNRHNKLFNNVAVDSCGSCHDYQQQTNSGGIWPGAVPISQRVHAVHAGATLHYPNVTVSHADGIPGRDWDITYPTELRTCDANCHGPTTSGSWKTKPARLPCMGCHDTDAATAHFRDMTYDPTPLSPFSGDEREACAACHAPAN